MSFFSNWRINTRLTVSFSFMAVLLLAVIAVGYVDIRLVFGGVQKMQGAVSAHAALEEIHVGVLTLQNDLVRQSAAPAAGMEMESGIHEKMQAVEALFEGYKGLEAVVSDDKREALAGFTTAWTAYRQAVEQALADLEAGNRQQALQSLTDGAAWQQSQAVLSSVQTLSVLENLESETIFEAASGIFQRVQTSMFVVAFAAAVIALGFGYVNAASLVKPIQLMATMLSNLGRGELNREIPQEKKEALARRRDEVGMLARGCLDVEAYMREGTAVTYRLATGDLSRKVRPFSDKDEMGLAYKEMVQNLRSMVREVEAGVGSLNEASVQLAEFTARTGETAERISRSMEQVAGGSLKQSEGVKGTLEVVEQISRAVEGVARGAQEQAQAVNHASTLMGQMLSIIDTVTENTRLVSEEAQSAAEKTRQGSAIVQETVDFMDDVRAKVHLTAARVQEMGIRSQEIGVILETIQEIASQTNLLALNAAIEAARNSGMTHQISQRLLQAQLTSVARLFGEMVARCERPLSNEDIASLAQQTGVDTLLVSDADGVITHSNEVALIGFRFSEDPKEQSHAFRCLLTQDDGVVAQPPQARSKDGKMFMWVGVSRRDQPGIIQAGMSAEAIQSIADYGRGFAVVAEEVRKLAERSRTSAGEIGKLVQTIQHTVREAVEAMEESQRGVEMGAARSNQAGGMLREALGAVDTVKRQAEEAVTAVKRMEEAIHSLSGSMDSVSAVVEENTAATEEMAAGQGEVFQAVEQIASVSQENLQAIEEISGVTREISLQVEEMNASTRRLAEMAHSLQQLVNRFNLVEESASSVVQGV